MLHHETSFSLRLQNPFLLKCGQQSTVFNNSLFFCLSLLPFLHPLPHCSGPFPFLSHLWTCYCLFLCPRLAPNFIILYFLPLTLPKLLTLSGSLALFLLSVLFHTYCLHPDGLTKLYLPPSSLPFLQLILSRHFSAFLSLFLPPFSLCLSLSVSSQILSVSLLIHHINSYCPDRALPGMFISCFYHTAA